MKRKQKVVRNPLVAIAMFRKAGAHGKSEKALRREGRIALQRERGVTVARGFGLDSPRYHQQTKERSFDECFFFHLFLGSQVGKATHC